jgi:hypothetical protein
MATSSVAALLGIGQETLLSRFQALPSEKFEEEGEGTFEMPDLRLWRHIVGDVVAPIPDVVHWFHATRVPRGTTFSEGLLPLGDRIEPIREHLSRLKASHGIENVDGKFDAGHSRFLYDSKVQNRSSWGPHAYLVRDAIVRPDGINHDYLAIPEIVEDLVWIMAGKNGSELIDAFRANTVSCIVKFRSREPREDVVPIALLYCYYATHGEAPGINGNTCYAGRGVAVAPGDILGVEFVG